MIFSNKKIVIKSVKAGVLRSVSIKDFRPSRTEIFRAICIPPFYDVFPKKFNFGAFAKPTLRGSRGKRTSERAQNRLLR